MKKPKFNTAETYFINKKIRNQEFLIHELNAENLGKAIRELRKRRGISQAQLGKLVNLSNMQISKIENANRKNTNLERISSIFTALNAKIYFQGEYGLNFRKPIL